MRRPRSRRPARRRRCSAPTRSGQRFRCPTTDPIVLDMATSMVGALAHPLHAGARPEDYSRRLGARSRRQADQRSRPRGEGLGAADRRPEGLRPRAHGRAPVQRAVGRRARLPGHLRERGQAPEHDQPVLLRHEPGGLRRARRLRQARRPHRRQGSRRQADRRRVAAAAAGRARAGIRSPEPRRRLADVRQPAARAEARRRNHRETI